MRSSMVLGAALAALVFVGAASAQPQLAGGGCGGVGAGGFGGFGGGGLAFMLRGSKAIQDELKMDKEQIDKLGESMNKLAEETRDIFQKLRDATPEERTEML